jgi:hypothetical protein
MGKRQKSFKVDFHTLNNSGQKYSSAQRQGSWPENHKNDISEFFPRKPSSSAPDGG